MTTRLIQIAAVDSTEACAEVEFPLDGLLSHPSSGSVLRWEEEDLQLVSSNYLHGSDTSIELAPCYGEKGITN